jgi:uncharacterized repeat protein (TIGR03847 family)
MPSRRFIFDAPDRFVAEALGEPGRRTFYLQAAQGRRIVTVVLEKVQVAVLAERLTELMAEMEHRGIVVPPDPANISTAGLDEPVIEAFRVGAMSLSWDSDRNSILFEAREVTTEDGSDDDDDDDEDHAHDDLDVLLVRLTTGAARGFVARATAVLSAGRLPCPLCGQPLNPEGHICPRKNGYMN